MVRLAAQIMIDYRALRTLSVKRKGSINVEGTSHFKCK